MNLKINMPKLTIPTVAANMSPLQKVPTIPPLKSILKNFNKVGSMLDPIKETLCPDVFDSNGKLFPHLRKQIIEGAYNVLPKENIEEMFLIGAITSYQWSDTGDIDINVAVNPPELADTSNETVNSVRHQFNGKLAEGTQHPINYFLYPWQGVGQFWGDSIYGVYDLYKDKWVNSPGKPEDFRDPNEEFAIELITAKHVEEIFLRYVYRYKKAERQLEFLTAKLPEEIEWPWLHNWHIQKKQAEVAKRYDELLSLIKSIDLARKYIYSEGWGIPRKDWRNIVFKKIEDSEASDIFSELKELKIPKPDLSKEVVLENEADEARLKFPWTIPGAGQQINS